MITDEMIEAAALSDAEFDGRNFVCMGRVERERYMLRSKAALTAALSASPAGPFGMRHEEGGYVEFLNEDLPTVVREIDGRVAILTTLEQPRKVVGYRVYDPDSSPSEVFGSASPAGVKPNTLDQVRVHLHLIRCFADEMRERNWGDKKLYIKQQVDRIGALLWGIEPAGVGIGPIVCDVLTMQHSSGFPDHFTRVRVGERELTLFMSKIKGRCEYHAAELNWLLNGAEKPHVLDFSDDEPEGLSDYLAALTKEAGVGVEMDLIERIENCVLFSTPAEYAGLADHAAFEAGQDNAIANVVKMLRAALKEATHD